MLAKNRKEKLVKNANNVSSLNARNDAKLQDDTILDEIF